MSDVAASTVPVQVESIQTGGPVSESALFGIAGPINYALQNKASVGDIMMSALDQSTFQAQRGTSWVLCDGRNVTGSTYQSLTGQTNIPDLRGVFPRGKDNGRGINPDGDLAIGAYTADKFAAHHHQYQSPNGGSGGGSASGTTGQAPFSDTTTVGANETAPKSCTVNFFIKINI